MIAFCCGTRRVCNRVASKRRPNDEPYVRSEGASPTRGAAVVNLLDNFSPPSVELLFNTNHKNSEYAVHSTDRDGAKLLGTPTSTSQLIDPLSAPLTDSGKGRRYESLCR